MDQTVTRAELCHLAKFRWNRWNRSRDMAIFQLFKMAAAAILDFWNCKFPTVGRVMNVELRYHAKFSGDRSNRYRDIYSSLFTINGSTEKKESDMQLNYITNT